MGHIPHLYLPPVWSSNEIELSDEQHHHLERVLRLKPGSSVSYTDGEGRIGQGRFEGTVVARGEERSGDEVSRDLVVAVAPPRAKDRARFLVEKLAEMGVRELVWVGSGHGEGHPPRTEKAVAWAQGGLEQSRGCRLMKIREAMRLSELSSPVMVADPQAPGIGELDIPRRVTVAIGPEGGWAPGELDGLGAARFGLGPRVLRVETAAIVAAALILNR